MYWVARTLLHAPNLVKRVTKLFWQIQHEVNIQWIRVRQKVSAGIQQHLTLPGIFGLLLGIAFGLLGQHLMPLPESGESLVFTNSTTSPSALDYPDGDIGNPD
jgi:hypothetical protein